MINVEIAGIPFRLENRYSLIERLSADYLTDAPPLHTITLTEEEIAAEEVLPDRKTPPEYLESAAFHRKIAEILPRYDAIVCHGAAIACAGGAYLIAARSGVGKTTHIRLWEKVYPDDVFILNGDKPVVHLKDGLPYVYGTPWKGKENYGRRGDLPLRGIAFLERAPENTASFLSPGEAFAPWTRQIYLSREPELLERTFAVVRKILPAVRLCRLGCNMEDEAARVARRALIEGIK